VVGISQRRTRAGARFQCAVARRWEPDRLAGLLALEDGERAALAVDLATAARPVPGPAGALVDALLARL